MTKLIPIADWCALPHVNVSAARARVLAQAGRIAGAIKPGREWLVPARAKKPKDRPGGRPAKTA